MKKVFALVLALGAMTAVFAQRGYDHRNESRDVILGQPNGNVYNNGRGYNQNIYYNTGERDEQIRRINREYNWRIESVRHNHHLRKAEKRRQIRFLENERNARIREVLYRHNRYHDRDDRSRGRF